MASIEGQIYRLLSQDTQLVGMLATWAGTPAIFHLFAPQESEDWSGDFHSDEYPSIRFSIDREGISDRGTAGKLEVRIWGIGSDQRKKPMPVAERVRDVLHMATIHCNDGVAGFRWLSWNAESPINEIHDSVQSATLLFDLIIFSSQETWSPDPVRALNEFTEKIDPSLQVDPEIWIPSDEKPAVYWRFSEEKHRLHLPIATWMVGTFHGHVIAPSAGVRRYWSRRILSHLLTTRTLFMNPGPRLLTIIDGSEFFDNDPLRVGQIRVHGDYINANLDAPDELVQNIYLS